MPWPFSNGLADSKAKEIWDESQKVLLIGDKYICESRCTYCGDLSERPDCRFNFASDVINYVNQGKTAYWTPYFRNLERALAGKMLSDEESKEIWDSLAFTNFVQKAVFDRKDTPTPDLYKKAAPAFYELLEELRPRRIIVLSKRLYHLMPKEEGRFRESGGRITSGNCSGILGEYILADAKTVIPVMWIKSPAQAFSRGHWHNILNKFINNNA